MAKVSGLDCYGTAIIRGDTIFKRDINVEGTATINTIDVDTLLIGGPNAGVIRWTDNSESAWASTHNNNLLIQNDQGTTNQRLLIGDTDVGANAMMLALDARQGGGDWDYIFSVGGDGEIYSNDNKVWHAGNFNPSGTPEFSAGIKTDLIQSRGTEIIIAAGEMSSWLSSTQEAVLIGGESGVYVYSSADNSGADHHNILIDTSGDAIFNGYVNVNTPTGDLQIGSRNTGYCHFETDRDKFYMNTELRVNGEMYISSGYNSRVMHDERIHVTDASTMPSGGSDKDLWFHVV